METREQFTVSLKDDATTTGQWSACSFHQYYIKLKSNCDYATYSPATAIKFLLIGNVIISILVQDDANLTNQWLYCYNSIFYWNFRPVHIILKDKLIGYLYSELDRILIDKNQATIKINN